MKFMDTNFRLFNVSSRERGLDYFQKGKVHDLSFKDLSAKATVEGERDYKVHIDFNKSGKVARASCTCPYSFGGFCKHIAATIYELDYQINEGFIDDEEKGEELLTDAEKFCKECYNESYRIGYKDVPDFYTKKEDEILSRSEKWSENDLIDNISYLYTLRLPMAVNQTPYSRYLSFMKGKGYSMRVKKETFFNIYSRNPYYNFLDEAFKDKEFNEVVNSLLADSIAQEGDLRRTIIYNLDYAGPYLSEDNLMALLTKTGPYEVNKEKLLEIFIKRDFKEGIEEIASSRYLSTDALYDLALYYGDEGDEEKARTFYKKLLSKSRDLPFDFFVSYWTSLNDEEKVNEYSAVYEAARNSRHEKPFAILIGRGKKSDLRGLSLEEYSLLSEEVKSQFPEEYLPLLLDKTEKKLSTNGYTQLTFPEWLDLCGHYPLLLSSMAKKKNPSLVNWLNDLNKRKEILVLLRDYGLLKDMHIHLYKEAE